MQRCVGELVVTTSTPNHAAFVEHSNRRSRMVAEAKCHGAIRVNPSSNARMRFSGDFGGFPGHGVTEVQE